MVQNHQTVLAVDMPQTGGSKYLDDDGKNKRTGSVWTASAHIITAVIGSGVLSLAWATAQLGWLAGPVVMLLFSAVTYFTSSLLAACYRSGDPISGKRNYTYMDAVRSNLGGVKVTLCGIVQYLNIFGVAIGYTIASAISMMAIKRSNCFHKSGGKDPCHMNSNPYMIAFGLVQILFSQIPDFDQLWWLSILAAVMSFTYSSAGLALGIAQVVVNGKVKGSLTGISIGAVTETQKIWRTFQALGDIAFAYSYSIILIEIQVLIPSLQVLMIKAINYWSHHEAFFILGSETGHSEVTTIRREDDEEGNTCERQCNDYVLYVVWMYGICSLWRLVSGKSLNRFRVL
jgi:hypothetical protein